MSASAQILRHFNFIDLFVGGETDPVLTFFSLCSLFHCIVGSERIQDKYLLVLGFTGRVF